MIATNSRPKTFSEVAGQFEAVETLKSLAGSKFDVKSILIKGAWGSGKCVPAGTRVLTNEGYIKIEDFLKNENRLKIVSENENESVYDLSDTFVYGNKGEVKQATGFYVQNSAEVFTVETVSGRTVRGTGKHKIKVKDGNSFKMISISELSEGQELAFDLHCFNKKEENDEEFARGRGLGITFKMKIYSEEYGNGPKFIDTLVLEENPDFRLGFLVGYMVGPDFLKLPLYFDSILESLSLGFLREGENLRLLGESSNLIYGIESIQDFQLSKITSIIRTSTEKVYDLFVPDGNLFYAQGIINHNTTLARLYGRAVNCENFNKIGDVCNTCHSCLEALQKNSQSYIEFDSTKVGSVDSIRSLDTLFSMAPVKGRRTLVFDEIHTASRQAQSALLKVLEEGVPNTTFMFCTTDEVIQTIKSRSLVLEVHTIPVPYMEKRIREVASTENIEISETHIRQICLKSGGHMRDAMQILELYKIVGESSLKTSLKEVKKFFYLCFKKEPIEEQLALVLNYPIKDIHNSIVNFLKDSFTSEDKFYIFMRKNQLHINLFKLMYSPESQEALRDEIGIELLLRLIHEKYS